MSKEENSRAILVFEGPWGLYEGDYNRSSVLPFVEGVAKGAENVEVYYTRFYDLSSFRLALEELSQVKAASSVVYIAAHGSGGLINNSQLGKILFEVNSAARTSNANITGVMLGSCYVGGKLQEMTEFVEGSPISWMAGYASESDWMKGTLIDVYIIDKMLHSDESTHETADQIVEQLACALSVFNPLMSIDSDSGNGTSLNKSIAAIAQPRGRGKRAVDITDRLRSEAWNSV